MSNSERRQKGIDKLLEVYCGDVAVLPQGASAFFDIMVEQLFSEVWTREALSQRDRRLLLLGAIAALGEGMTFAIQTKAGRGIFGIEMRIVEPMLQALVSVEAKLERSHIDLTKRSDQVEQRLTQLWDIEEQLGTLGELQESLLQVSEQQRRLESAVDRQTRTLRWLVGAIFFALAATVFVVAAMIR